MIEFFRSWVMNIVTSIIFIIFVEILVSSEKFKKYVKLVTGLVLMIIIINPIVTLLNKNYSLDSLAIQSSNTFEQKDIQEQAKSLDDAQKAQIISVYKEKLGMQIKEQILSVKGVKDADVETTIEEGSDSKFGTVLEIKAVITPGILKSSDNGVEIQKVDISHSKTEIILDQGVVNQIKEKLSTLYGISNEKIDIIAQKKGER